jgi:hypothetical protein
MLHVSFSSMQKEGQKRRTAGRMTYASRHIIRRQSVRVSLQLYPESCVLRTVTGEVYLKTGSRSACMYTRAATAFGRSDSSAQLRHSFPERVFEGPNTRAGLHIFRAREHCACLPTLQQFKQAPRRSHASSFTFSCRHSVNLPLPPSFRTQRVHARSD